MAKFNAGDRVWARNTEYITEPEWCQAIAISFDATHARCAWLFSGEEFSVPVGELKRFTYGKVVQAVWIVEASFISTDGNLCNHRTFWPEFDTPGECVNFVIRWLAIKEPFVHENMTSISARLAERDSVTGGWKTW